VNCLLVLNNTIFSANVGDSKAVLFRKLEDGKISFVKLSKDHNPSSVRGAIFTVYIHVALLQCDYLFNYCRSYT